ncbi:MAG TPA: hypothetical protein VFH56_03375 [Acidimicrobiales bacterium]|nr:hypothetical protein [Acidimicrobiales bacterium]
MPQDIKVGDIVRLTSKTYSPALRLGDMVTVVQTDAFRQYPYRIFKEGVTNKVGWLVKSYEIELVKPEPKFKVGDRVVVERNVFSLKAGDISTILRPSAVTAQTENYGTEHEEYRVKNPGGPYGYSLHYAGDLKLAPEEPKFSVGQRVRTTRPIECYSLEAGALGIVRRADDDPHSRSFPYKVSFPEKGDGYVFLAESEIEPAPTQEFKLKPGDRVRKLATGQEAIISGDMKVHVAGTHDIVSGNWICEARALEAWEAEHPGTYDLVVEENPPW